MDDLPQITLVMTTENVLQHSGSMDLTECAVISEQTFGWLHAQTAGASRRYQLG